MSDTELPSDGHGQLIEDAQETRLAVETPERVRIVYDLAGIGSRFAAGSLDMFILLCLWCGAATVFAFVAESWLTEMLNDTQALAFAAIGCFYVVLWGYYLGFETLWGGQTPGKYMMRLRVVSEEGGPASVSAIFVRNLLRIVDALPIIVAHVLGGVVMFINPRFKRVGDIAAGTIVVRERTVDLDLDRLRSAAVDASALVGDSLTDEEMDLARRFDERHHELTADSRADLARRIVQRIAERTELPDMDPENLVRLLAQGTPLSKLRDYGGPSLPDLEDEA